MQETKRCPGCQRTLPRSEFYPRAKGSTLLVSRCKACLISVNRRNNARSYQVRKAHADTPHRCQSHACCSGLATRPDLTPGWTWTLFGLARRNREHSAAGLPLIGVLHKNGAVEVWLDKGPPLRFRGEPQAYTWAKRAGVRLIRPDARLRGA